MDESQPSGSEATGSAASDESTWVIGVRPRCFHCDRLAVTHDSKERPLCARHATIFMTATSRNDPPDPPT
jgi:hypothetical protein